MKKLFSFFNSLDCATFAPCQKDLFAFLSLVKGILNVFRK